MFKGTCLYLQKIIQKLCIYFFQVCLKKFANLRAKLHPYTFYSLRKIDTIQRYLLKIKDIDKINMVYCGIIVNAAALCPAVDVVNCPYIDGIGVHM
jgi:hypothetical protein